MPDALVLQYGDERHLMVKPEKGGELFNGTRRLFKELKHLADEDITFMYHPNWSEADIAVDEAALPVVPDFSTLKVVAKATKVETKPGEVIDLTSDRSEYRLAYVHIQCTPIWTAGQKQM